MVLVLTALGAFALSIIAKFLADVLLVSRVPVFGSFAGLLYSVNPGVAFSISFPGPLQNILIGAAIGALFLAARKAQTRLSKISFGLILGGALANIADRLFDGVVTDFFQVGTFPIFNVADSCITIGVGLLAAEALTAWYRQRAGK